jgi:hypothetical protein
LEGDKIDFLFLDKKKSTMSPYNNSNLNMSQENKELYEFIGRLIVHSIRLETGSDTQRLNSIIENYKNDLQERVQEKADEEVDEEHEEPNPEWNQDWTPEEDQELQWNSHLGLKDPEFDEEAYYATIRDACMQNGLTRDTARDDFDEEDEMTDDQIKMIYGGEGTPNEPLRITATNHRRIVTRPPELTRNAKIYPDQRRGLTLEDLV